MDYHNNNNNNNNKHLTPNIDGIEINLLCMLFFFFLLLSVVVVVGGGVLYKRCVDVQQQQQQQHHHHTQYAHNNIEDSSYVAVSMKFIKIKSCHGHFSVYIYMSVCVCAIFRAIIFLQFFFSFSMLIVLCIH